MECFSGVQTSIVACQQPRLPPGPRQLQLREFRRFLFLCVLTILLALATGCSNSNSPSESPPSVTPGPAPADNETTMAGIFVDDPVAGLQYDANGRPGVTDAQGTYYCNTGEVIVFHIDNVTLGRSECASVTSPLDLLPDADADDPRVMALASFLQSMDNDGNASNGVIYLSAYVRVWIQDTLTELGIDRLDLGDMSPDAINAFGKSVVAHAGRSANVIHPLVYIPPEQAATNLQVSLASFGQFRKNISASPELDTDSASMAVMHDVVVTPQRADGTPATTCDTAGDCLTPPRVNPLLSFYVEPPGNKTLARPFWGNDDAWVAVSLDNGVSWKRSNLSSSSDQAVDVGDAPYADVNHISGAVAGNRVLVSWISTWCPDRNPMNLAPVQGDAASSPPIPPLELDTMPPDAIGTPARYNTYDLFGNVGPQGVVDYANPNNPEYMFEPEVGKVAFHCVWAARGVLDADTGNFTWYAPEQITSGVRDANLNVVAAAASPDNSQAAFAITWQADPIGLSKGEGAGAGVGWCGSHTNKGTDIWYTAIALQCFAGTSGAQAQQCYPASNITDSDARPAPAYRMSAPVPVSDDAACTLGAQGWNKPYCQPLAKAFGTMLQTKKGMKNTSETVTLARSGQKNPMCAVQDIERSPYWTDPGWPTTMGTLQTQCDDFDAAVNSVPLDGNTGAARPELRIVFDESIGGMRAVLSYEEHKALGFLCGNDATCKAERLDYMGKFVLFNSFPVGTPDVISPGGMINRLTTNYMDTNEDGVGDTVRQTSTGIEMRYIFENDRNSGLAVQDANNAAFANGRIGSRDLRMLISYKEGLFSKSQTSDLMIRRACGGYEYANWGSCSASESTVQGVTRDPICISCMSVTSASPQSVSNRTQCSACHDPSVVSYTSSDSAINATALDWRFEYNSISDNNLFMDPADGISKSTSSYNPLDDIKSPRAVLAGDVVMVSFTHAANWPLAHHYKASYDAFLRRSFDGGFSWTNADRTWQQGPVNISGLIDPAVTAEEPIFRLPADCGFDAAASRFTCPDAEGNPYPSTNVAIAATWCTASNTEIIVAADDLGKPVEVLGRDCYLAMSPDLGETFINVRDTAGDSSSIALVSGNHDTANGSVPCNGDILESPPVSLCKDEAGFDFLAHGDDEILAPDIQLVPSLVPDFTHTLHSTWLQRREVGADAWYRRVDMTVK